MPPQIMSDRSWMRGLLFWAAVASSLVWAAVTWGRAGATLVALVTTDPSAELSQRVEEQLEALGFDVIMLNPPPTGAVGAALLEQTARNVGAIAAIRIVPMAQSVQVWTADPVTGKSVFRETAPTSGQKPSDAAVALSAVELLRASLLELHPPEPPPPPKPAESAPVCPPPRAPVEKPYEPRLGVTVGAGMDFGLGGRPSVSWEAAIWLRLYQGLGVRFIGLATELPAEVNSAYGSVEVAAQIYGAELTYDLAKPSSSWIPVVGVGLAGADVTVRGSAPTTGYINVYESQWVALPFVHLGGSWAPVPSLRARVDVLGGLSAPKAAVTVCMQEANTCPTVETAAYWGQPVVNASLGLEVLFAP